MLGIHFVGFNSNIFFLLGEDIHWYIKFEKDDDTGFYYALPLLNE